MNDVNINAGAFTANILLGTDDDISRSNINDIAGNTAYNNRHSDLNLFIENDEYTSPSQDKTYDIGRNYIDKYLKLELGLNSSAYTMPFGINSTSTELTTEWLQLTTSFQTLPQNSKIQIKAEASGGFTIRVTTATTQYLLGSITECRKITGA